MTKVAKRSKIKCKITQDTTENQNGELVDCYQAVCGRCQHKTMVYGRDETAVNRCLLIMRSSCPRGENNIYAPANEE